MLIVYCIQKLIIPIYFINDCLLSRDVAKRAKRAIRTYQTQGWFRIHFYCLLVLILFKSKYKVIKVQSSRY